MAKGSTKKENDVATMKIGDLTSLTTKDLVKKFEENSEILIYRCTPKDKTTPPWEYSVFPLRTFRKFIRWNVLADIIVAEFYKNRNTFKEEIKASKNLKRLIRVGKSMGERDYKPAVYIKNELLPWAFTIFGDGKCVCCADVSVSDFRDGFSEEAQNMITQAGIRGIVRILCGKKGKARFFMVSALSYWCYFNFFEDVKEAIHLLSEKFPDKIPFVFEKLCLARENEGKAQLDFRYVNYCSLNALWQKFLTRLAASPRELLLGTRNGKYSRNKRGEPINVRKVISLSDCGFNQKQIAALLKRTERAIRNIV